MTKKENVQHLLHISYFCCTFAENFDNMENEVAVIVRFGKCLSVSFNAVEMSPKEGCRAFARKNTLGAVDAESGLFLISELSRQVVLQYDGIKITSGIFLWKETEGNHRLRCVSDLFSFDVYVLRDGCDESLFGDFVEE